MFMFLFVGTIYFSCNNKTQDTTDENNESTNTTVDSGNNNSGNTDSGNTDSGDTNETINSSGSADVTQDWMFNTDDERSKYIIENNGQGVLVNVQSVSTTSSNGVDYAQVKTTGVPNYTVTVDQDILAQLNTRPNASTDFHTGETTVTLGQVIDFGLDVGYDSGIDNCGPNNEGSGHWPPPIGCASNQNLSYLFPIEPTPTTTECYTDQDACGVWVNGTGIFNWTDTQSFDNQGNWKYDAFVMEFYDFDVCTGHPSNGLYHHHSYSFCLADQLNDDGSGHSPVYGWIADGYPIHGPWHSEGELSQSCWVTRNYDDPSDPTGCGGNGERNCKLIDHHDPSAGTEPTTSSGPNTSDVISSMSGNDFIAESGAFYPDYYWDSSCSAQAGANLDRYNGHDHDDLGYHYHVTVEEIEDALVPVFPYTLGPLYAGELPESTFASCYEDSSSGGSGNGPGGSPQ